MEKIKGGGREKKNKLHKSCSKTLCVNINYLLSKKEKNRRVRREKKGARGREWRRQKFIEKGRGWEKIKEEDEGWKKKEAHLIGECIRLSFNCDDCHPMATKFYASPSDGN